MDWKKANNSIRAVFHLLRCADTPLTPLSCCSEPCTCKPSVLGIKPGACTLLCILPASCQTSTSSPRAAARPKAAAPSSMGSSLHFPEPQMPPCPTAAPTWASTLPLPAQTRARFPPSPLPPSVPNSAPCPRQTRFYSSCKCRQTSCLPHLSVQALFVSLWLPSTGCCCLSLGLWASLQIPHSSWAEPQQAAQGIWWFPHRLIERAAAVPKSSARADSQTSLAPWAVKFPVGDF